MHHVICHYLTVIYIEDLTHAVSFDFGITWRMVDSKQDMLTVIWSYCFGVIFFNSSYWRLHNLVTIYFVLLKQLSYKNKEIWYYCQWDLSTSYIFLIQKNFCWYNSMYRVQICVHVDVSFFYRYCFSFYIYQNYV